MPMRMHLALGLSWTQVATASRDAASGVGPGYPGPALLDMTFFGDGTGNAWRDDISDAGRLGVAWPRMDMSPWTALMSRVTRHVAFGLTCSASFMHPFHTARLLP